MSMRWELIRDVVAFINEAGQIPNIVVQTKHVSVCGVPEHVVGNDGRVTLNVSEGATLNLRIGMYQIQFDCRFGGQHANIAMAPEAVEAVFAHGADGVKLVLPSAPVEEQMSKKPNLTVVH